MNRGHAIWILVLPLVAVSTVIVVAQTSISTDGAIESTSGGFIFPDGTVQATAATAGVAPVADTGQGADQCWNEDGDAISCSGSGQDGEFEAGVDWPAPRFTDNLDGTVTDALTGLIWLQDAECFGEETWQGALDAVTAFALGAHGCANYPAQVNPSWRLANVKELTSLIDYGEGNPALPVGHPFIDVHSGYYWTSSSYVPNPTFVWYVYPFAGFTSNIGKDYSGGYVWPVRGGQ